MLKKIQIQNQYWVLCFAPKFVISPFRNFACEQTLLHFLFFFQHTEYVVFTEEIILKLILQNRQNIKKYLPSYIKILKVIKLLSRISANHISDIVFKSSINSLLLLVLTFSHLKTLPTMSKLKETLLNAEAHTALPNSTTDDQTRNKFNPSPTKISLPETAPDNFHAHDLSILLNWPRPRLP